MGHRENDKQRANSSIFATFPQEIIDAANEFMKEPEFVLTNTEKLDILQSTNIALELVVQQVVGCRASTEMDRIPKIIFTNTKRMVELLVRAWKTD